MTGRSPQVAIAHEWVAQRAGSEKVFERLAGLFPSADLYALTQTPGVHLNTNGRPITTSILDHYGIRDRRNLSLPLMPVAWSLLRGKQYDVIITSSHAFSRWFARRAGAQHYCYVHTPMRYAWDPAIDSRSQVLGHRARRILQRLDLKTIPGVVGFAANSSITQERIRRYYGRDSIIIHPPVDTDFFTPGDPKKGYALAVGRFVKYKALDIAIAVAEVADVPLILAGSGPEESALRMLAAQSRVPVTIRIDPNDAELRGLYQQANVLIFPGVEDFGIVPVEAQASGTPVVGPKLGGLCDTVRDGVTGFLSPSQKVADLALLVQRAFSGELKESECREWALRFAPERFDREIAEWVDWCEP